MQTKKQTQIAERLWIPTDTQALLWDMDGVLIDSLSLDLVVCNQLLQQHFGNHVTVSKAFIRSLFAYDPHLFWELILASVEKTYQLPDAKKSLANILATFNQARRDCIFELNPGISDILQAAAAQSLKMAVVSNNPTADVKAILHRSGILNYFEQVVGNDIQTIAKKPAPDTYLLAARLLAVHPKQCVVIEDTLVGLEAGYHANCYTIGVATGGDAFETLGQAQWAQQIYSAFAVPHISLQFGDVRKKQITTPNEFISHAIEHIAWRLGVEIVLHWHNNDWWALGKALGRQIRTFELQEPSATALGMIDDGSAEVSIQITDTPALRLEAVTNIDLDWFLSLRCEQLSSGQPLVALAQGLAHGVGAQLAITVCSLEDPHHTWEGIFRSIGIALNKMFTPKHPAALPFDYKIEEHVSRGEISVLAKSLHYSKVCRGTAESYVEVAVDFAMIHPNTFTFQVAPTIAVNEVSHLLELLATAAGFTLQVDFHATVLSSSHVVLEDTGLVLGRALLEILTVRMERWGVNGAGSSLESDSKLATPPIRVGLSVEGRKFWKLVPFKDSPEKLRQEFILGQTIYNDLRSEDLDDFLDGLSGGLACSIMVHIEELSEPSAGWQLLFTGLGKAIREVFAWNPYRKGVPPGVKATLS